MYKNRKILSKKPRNPYRNPYIRKIIEEKYKELYALYPYSSANLPKQKALLSF